ncbi:hypothetical protein CHT99_13400 [Sphingobacterium cellulitidis]|nr:hypothetical protein CHT99_13400 [Sphingobacterium cellulitidis]
MSKKIAWIFFMITLLLLGICAFEIIMQFQRSALSYPIFLTSLSLIISALLFLKNALRPMKIK